MDFSSDVAHLIGSILIKFSATSLRGCVSLCARLFFLVITEVSLIRFSLVKILHKRLSRSTFSEASVIINILSLKIPYSTTSLISDHNHLPSSCNLINK